MKNTVLADTGPLYAAVDPDDQYHTRSQQELQRLATNQYTVLLPCPILLEAYTLILYRLGKQVAKTWCSEVIAGTVLINPLSHDYNLAINKVAEYSDQKITLFDSVLAILAERLHYPVWTYDFHFDVMQTAVWR